MRIISKFRDYYDSLMSHDDRLLYLRKQEENILDPWPFPKLRFDRAHGYSSNYGIIGFCGRIFGYVKLHDNRYAESGIERETAICYSVEAVDAFMGRVKSKSGLDDYMYGSGKTHQFRRRHHNFDIFAPDRQRFVNFFTECSDISGTFSHLFTENLCPIFVAHAPRWSENHGKVTWNGRLQELNFIRIFPPYQAFQEISTFMGTMAMPNKLIPDVSDEDMAAAKGFDEWSFRKEPTKKRQ